MHRFILVCTGLSVPHITLFNSGGKDFPVERGGC